MTDYKFRSVKFEDIEYMARNLRAADRAEIEAVHGAHCPLHILAQAVRQSSLAWTAEANGRPFALFGVAPMGEGAGSIWLLGTEELFKYPRALVRGGREVLAVMFKEYARLYNFMDARNTKSIAWLRRMGFTVHEPQPYGAAGLPFHLFERGSNV